MGVTHKLKPEIIEFILENKRNNKQISCRSLVAQVHTRFKVKVSKSSINEIFKDAGLSMPVGRPAENEAPQSGGSLKRRC